MEAANSKSSWVDSYWTSSDGLKLYFRDYPARDDIAKQGRRPPIICMHGLTRNSRDFAGLAEYLSTGWRVLVPEMRGRGNSEYATDSSSYNPLTYVADIQALLDQQGIDRFIAIGTSLGGLMTMLLATIVPERLAGAVLNDIGPEVNPAGIDKIKAYVGQGRSFPTWMHAARALQEVHSEAHPRFTIEDWLTMAKRGMVVQQNGRIGFDYDMAIAEPFNQVDGAVPPDLWPAYAALAGRPLLLVRGALSNLLTLETFGKMQERIADAAAVTIADVGHAPLLDEPEARAAIDSFLDRIS